MREFEVVFDKGLVGGLRSEDIEPAKEQRLVELKNMRPHEFGLRPVEPMVNPFDAVFAYPFPQMFLLRSARVMATETAIYECDSSWSPTLKLSELTPGGLWHVADFGQYILMTNGSQMVRRNSSGAWSSFTSTSSVPAMKTVCNFRGQAIGGNISDWEDCDESYVAWSDIGYLEFYPGNRVYSGASTEQIPKNESGYVQMTWNGEVLKVMELGGMVAVYGENGVSLLKPAQQYMGVLDLDLPGIPVAGAVGGSAKGHVFVDYSGELWFMSAEGKPQNLGYGEFISAMDAAEIVVSYNRQQDEYYISDGSTTYLLGKHGLCQTHQLVSSLAYDNGVLYGTWESDGDGGALVVTDTLDFGQRAFKTVEAVSASCSSDNDMWVKLFWRSDVKASWNQSDWQWINPTGFVTPMVTAVDFRIAFKADSYEDLKLAFLKSRIKLSDHRLIRGIYNAA